MIYVYTLDQDRSCHVRLSVRISVCPYEALAELSEARKYDTKMYFQFKCENQNNMYIPNVDRYFI